MILPALLAITLIAQGPRTLADAVKGMNWNPTTGTLIVLDPDRVRETEKAPGLAGFRRKQITVGTLTAIVPTEMVVIDDSFKQPPSMTEGLPREAKVLYLLQSLSGDQWTKVNGANGIGLNDLQGEQRAVFESLLPKPFAWAAYRVNAKGDLDKKEDEGKLAGEQVSKVRLRLGRRLSFHTELQNVPNAYTMHGTDEDYGDPGDLQLIRDQQADFDQPDSYGVVARSTTANKLKFSELAYTDPSLAATVKLPAKSSVRDLLILAGRATGKEIHADVRIADLSASILGEQAKAGDILQALALAVTGTYRRVGSAYVLTSDLIGLGTRKLKFSTWWEELNKTRHELQGEWKKKIGTRVDGLSVDAKGKYKPSEAMLKHLGKMDSYPTQDWIDSSELSPETRLFLKRMSERWAHQPVRTDHVKAESTVEYMFVLPDGRSLRPEQGALGQTWTFHPVLPPVRQQQDPPKIELPVEAPAEGFTQPLLLKVENLAEAKAAVEQALLHGFREVWLDTRNQAALSGAVEDASRSGMRVTLFVNPWSTAGRLADPDRNLLGDTGTTLAKRVEGTEDWKSALRQNMTPFRFDDRMTPFDESVSGVWNSIVSLAGTPGLKEVILGETMPPGYEPHLTRALYGAFSRGQGQMRQFGYSAGQRLAFLRANRMDPLDIVPEELMTGPDLRQPFFLDDNLRGLPSVYDGRDEPHPALAGMMAKWLEFRSQANEKAIVSLATRITAKSPVRIDLRSSLANFPGLGAPMFLPWTPGSPLPIMASDEPYRTTGIENAQGLRPLPTQEEADRDPLALRMLTFGMRPQAKLAIDGRNVPVRILVETLDYWFKRR